MLRAGLAGACTLIAAGLALAALTGQHGSGAVRMAALASDGTSADRVMALGILLLAATPVLRVVALIGVWLWERDYRFALLGLAVLVVLTASALSGSG